MSIMVIQPFNNPYSLHELETRFNINLNKFTESDKAEYRLYNRGRLAKYVKTRVDSSVGRAED